MVEPVQSFVWFVLAAWWRLCWVEGGHVVCPVLATVIRLRTIEVRDEIKIP